MKRIVLCLRRPRGKSVWTRTLALPADWTLRHLFDAILSSFPDLFHCGAIAFTDAAHGRSCGGALEPDDDVDWDDGMTMDWPLRQAFPDDGDTVACRCSEEGGNGSCVDFPITRLRSDTGPAPECLEAAGPASGRDKPVAEDIDDDLSTIQARFSAPDSDDPFLHAFAAPPHHPPRTNPPWRSPDLPPPPPPAEPLALDDSPAVPALHRRACELARRVWDLAPWNFLEENIPVALPLPGERERILSVMGHSGEYRSLAFYPALSTLHALHSLNPFRAPFGPNYLFSFWHWQLAFLKTPELHPGQSAAVKASGVKFPRGHLPSFETVAPGFLQHPAGGRELADLAELLDAAVDLFSDDDAMDVLLRQPPAPGAVHLWARPSPDAPRRLSPATRPVELRFPLDLPPLLLAGIRALPLDDRLVSFGEISLPMGKPPRRRCCRHIVFAADETNGLVIPPQTGFDDDDDVPPTLYHPANLLADIAKTLLRSPIKCFPSRLASPCDFMALFLRRLAELRGGGARFDSHAPCDKLLEFHSALSSALGF